MDIIKFLTRLAGRTSEIPPQTHSYLLQLPVELLVKIFAFLPSYSQLLVYRTCRPLRAIIHHHFLAGRGEILVTRQDRLLYLTHLARSLPDRWVCAGCYKLHPTCSWDTPSSDKPYLPKCGDGKAFEENNESRKLLNIGYSPTHRHVELTLKYARLNSQKRKHQKHLQRLLTPHHNESQRADCMDVTEGILLQRSFYPKVVDGRYLLFTVEAYLGVGTTVSRQSIRFMKICHHLCSYAAFPTRENQRISLDMILHEAFSAPPNTRLLSSCFDCSTDFCVQVSPERALVCTWKDLGPEGTVHDWEWGALVRETTVLWHPPGSIRELYGPQEHNGKVYY